MDCTLINYQNMSMKQREHMRLYINNQKIPRINYDKMSMKQREHLGCIPILSLKQFPYDPNKQNNRNNPNKYY